MNENLFEDIKNQADIIIKIQKDAYKAGYEQGKKDKDKEMLGEAEKDEAKVEQLENK